MAGEQGSAIWTLARKLGLPTDGPGQTKLALESLQEIKESLRALVLLDDKLRAERSLVAERAFDYKGATITSAALFKIEDSTPAVNTDTYTTIFCAFAAASGAGRYLYNGNIPATGGAVGSGLPIPAGFSTLIIVGRENIRNLRIIAEGATNVLLDYQLYR